ncbi:MAG: hypothetical protein CMJ34_00835 [Phycisphaerae bacterium]|nr:hypothetical protein [Phycisphaerae bacterium]
MQRTDSAVIGDVHGCSQELEELLEILLESRAPRRIRLVGDLLTRGPDPAGVVALIRRTREAGVDIHSTCGNHDLRLYNAMVRHRRGIGTERLSRVDRRTIERLGDEARRHDAFELLTETVDRIRSTAGPATVIHAGIDPVLGLEGTSDHELVHRKAGPGQRHWWKDYDGRDGLIVVGHKRVGSPVRVRRAGRPIAVDVDTGCVTGGRLTAYLVERDEFIEVESRQVRRNPSDLSRIVIEVPSRPDDEAAVAG